MLEVEAMSMTVTKEVLTQYCDMREEIKDLQSRIIDTERKIEHMLQEGVQVSDTVTGTRKDGTIGSIKITGFPLPTYERLQKMNKQRVQKLRVMEDELHEALHKVDSFIEAIPKSELRLIFRLYYLDDMTWIQVARNMNHRFPKRKHKYTEDSCRMKHNRYLEKIKENS